MDKREKVAQLVTLASDKKIRAKIMQDRQARLQYLVNKHGYELVEMASGLSMSTLVQYLRAPNPESIGEESVNRAESILNQLD